MCDHPEQLVTGWAGWVPPAQSRARYKPLGDWLDLSHPIDERTPRVAFFPPPQVKRLRSLPEDRLNVTQMSMVVHIGTHVDAPIHLFGDASAMQEIPLERLTGAGYVLPVDIPGSGLIEPVHLEAARGKISAGEILLLNTGIHRLAYSDAYEDHPALSLAAAQWLVDQGIKMIAVDFATPDTAVMHRDASFDYPIHRQLLGHGVLIAEHVTNLDALNAQRVEIMCAALNLTHADGAPVRLMARSIIDI